LCSLVCVGITALLAGASSLLGTVTNSGCGHPYGDNTLFYPCDDRHGPPCSKDTDSCLMEWLPPGMYWGGCVSSYVDAYDCLTDDSWEGTTTSRPGECQTDCSCIITAPPFEDHGVGVVSYYGGLCTGS
jgi:hypothetical protein